MVTGRVNDAISVSACCVEGDLLETRVGVAGLNDQDVTQLAGASCPAGSSPLQSRENDGARACVKVGYIARDLHLPLIRSSNEMIDGGGEWEQTRGESPMG